MQYPDTKSYRMLGGGRVTGSTPDEMVKALRSSSMYPMKTVADFMSDIASRCMAYDHDAYVRTDDPAEFIEDLLHYEFLTEELPYNVMGFPGCTPNTEDGP